jgi:hypothetical protein
MKLSTLMLDFALRQRERGHQSWTRPRVALALVAGLAVSIVCAALLVLWVMQLDFPAD